MSAEAEMKWEMKSEEYSKSVEDYIKEAEDIVIAVKIFKDHLQQQFVKEFDDGSRNHNRGKLYAQCGTACQAMTQLLNGIVSDLKLIDDLPLLPSDEQLGIVQIF
jgi:hypothetical protein